MIFIDRQGNKCPLIVDYSYEEELVGGFLIDPWGGCPYVNEGNNYITFIDDGEDGKYIGPGSKDMTFYESVNQVSSDDLC